MSSHWNKITAKAVSYSLGKFVLRTKRSKTKFPWITFWRINKVLSSSIYLNDFFLKYIYCIYTESNNIVTLWITLINIYKWHLSVCSLIWLAHLFWSQRRVNIQRKREREKGNARYDRRVAVNSASKIVVHGAV